MYYVNDFVMGISFDNPKLDGKIAKVVNITKRYTGWEITLQLISPLQDLLPGYEWSFSITDNEMQTGIRHWKKVSSGDNIPLQIF